MQDLFYCLLGIAVVVLPIYFIIKKIKNRNKKEKVVAPKNNIEEPKKEKKEKPIRLKDIKHIEGISYLHEGQDCGLCIENDELTIISKMGNFNISLDRIVNAGISSKKEMESKNKSVLGRALVGSMVGLGAVGALSGVGQKVKNYYNYFLEINYKDKNSEEIKSVIFGLGEYGVIGQDFVNKLNKKLNKEKVNIEL